MTNSNNPGFLSQSNKTPSAQLIDGTDFPHSGLFKALSQQGRGNFAIQSGAFGTSGNFSIAQSISVRRLFSQFRRVKSSVTVN